MSFFCVCLFLVQENAEVAEERSRVLAKQAALRVSANTKNNNKDSSGKRETYVTKEK